MGWRSRLTCREVVATGIARSLVVLAHYGDVEGATAMLASDPSRADDPEALVAAAERGHEAIVRVLLQHQPRRADGALYEVACHEGNYGLRGILSGARAEESR
jgi:hypothetical protein